MIGTPVRSRVVRMNVQVRLGRVARNADIAERIADIDGDTSPHEVSQFDIQIAASECDMVSTDVLQAPFGRHEIWQVSARGDNFHCTGADNHCTENRIVFQIFRHDPAGAKPAGTDRCDIGGKTLFGMAGVVVEKGYTASLCRDKAATVSGNCKGLAGSGGECIPVRT